MIFTMPFNVENTNDVQQLEENECSKSSMQGAAGYTSKLLTEPLIAKGIYLCCFLSVCILFKGNHICQR